MGTKQNFKSALNELMAGKIATDGEDVDMDDYEEDTAPQPTEPVFSKPTYTSTYAPQPTHISVIAEDLLIEGNVKSKSDIRVDGHIKGNVICEGSIACGGVVEGDINCDSLIMGGCSINGNITAKADVSIDPDSTVIGDIRAHNLVANGRIKGNISTSGSTTLREKAMLMGNIQAKSISLDSGAALKGTLEVQTADLSEDDFKIAGKSYSAPEPAARVPEEDIFSNTEE